MAIVCPACRSNEKVRRRQGLSATNEAQGMVVTRPYECTGCGQAFETIEVHRVLDGEVSPLMGAISKINENYAFLGKLLRAIIGGVK